MMNLQRNSKIDKSLLSGKNYFSSLLFQAESRNVLSDDEVQRIKSESLEIVAKQAEKLTEFKSSSVRAETAQVLFSSVMFTLGVQLKSYPTPDDAVDALAQSKLSDLYKLGLKKTDIKILTAKTLYRKIKNEIFKTENVFYRSTIIDGIEGFFKLYQPEYSANEIHITADYPLYNPVRDLDGIEFIEKYLETALLENKLLLCFSPTAVHRVLSGIDENYQQILMNIFEPVFAVSLGCVLTERPLNELRCDAEELKPLFVGKSSEDINKTLNSALEKLIEELPAPSDLAEYMRTCVSELAESIRISSSLNHLETAFPQPKHKEDNPKVTLHYGERMKDSDYSNVLDELMMIDDAQRKAKLILERVSSFADLLDILRDSEMTKDEILTFVKSCPPEVTASLLAHYPDKDFLEDESEIVIYDALQDFVSSLPSEMAVKLKKAADAVIFNSQE